MHNVNVTWRTITNDNKEKLCLNWTKMISNKNPKYREVRNLWSQLQVPLLQDGPRWGYGQGQGCQLAQLFRSKAKRVYWIILIAKEIRVNENLMNWIKSRPILYKLATLQSRWATIKAMAPTTTSPSQYVTISTTSAAPRLLSTQQRLVKSVERALSSHSQIYQSVQNSMIHV